MTRGRKPITADTPPMTPSTSKADSKGLAFSSRVPTQAWKVSSQATRVSAMRGPTQAWEIWKTRNMMPAKMRMPATGLVRTASIRSSEFLSLVSTFRVSTLETILLTKSNRSRSAFSTAFLSVRSMFPSLYGASWLSLARATAVSTTVFRPSAEVETVRMTGQPSLADRASTSILVSFFSLMSLLFRATTTGMPSSSSCVVKNRLRLRFVASTMLMITSGFSCFT